MYFCKYAPFSDTKFLATHSRQRNQTFRNRSRLTGLLSRRNTASHRCHTGPGRSPSARHGLTVDAHFPPFCPGVQNQETPVGMSPGHNKFHMTPYGGMIRIRFKGRSDTASSQLASQAPLCFDCICDNTPNVSKMQWFFTQGSPGRPPASWSGNPSPPLGAGSNRWRRPLGPARSPP